MVARNTGPSSVTDTSSAGRGQETSTLTVSWGTGMERVLVAAGESPFLNSVAIAGGDAGSSSRSTPLILDSRDWEEAPRALGGTVRWKGGGELGRTVCGYAFWTQNEKLASVCSWCARWSYCTKLQEFLQPPPGSSEFFGGFHFQDQSNVTVGLPPVVKSPINSTLAFLCRFGSAWNSLVTKFSTSRGVEAYT